MKCEVKKGENDPWIYALTVLDPRDLPDGVPLVGTVRPHGGPGHGLAGLHRPHRRRAHHVHPLRPGVGAQVVVGHAAVHAAVRDGDAAQVQSEAAAVSGVSRTSVVGGALRVVRLKVLNTLNAM